MSKLMRPVPESVPISQRFYADATQFNSGAGHGAVDFAANLGTKVAAPAKSKVLWADWSDNMAHLSWPDRWFYAPGAGGIIVLLEILEGKYKGYKAGYSHLNLTELNIGDIVKAGDLIGYTGNTGTYTTGPHLHLDFMPPNPYYDPNWFGRIDPEPIFQGKYKMNDKSSTTNWDSTTGTGSTGSAVTVNLHGIDVSNYQKGINLKKLSTDFIGVLATDGRNFRSPTLDEQATAALKKGRTLVYHYARVKEGYAEVQAQVFLDAALPYINKGAIPVLDWEEDAFNHRADWAIRWINYVEAKTRKKVIVYQRVKASEDKSWGSFRRPMWLSWYGSSNRFDGYASDVTLPVSTDWDIVLWQYSDKGRLPGYKADLDFNVSYGDPWTVERQTGLQAYMEVLMSNETEREALADLIVNKLLTKKIERKGEYATKGPDTLGAVIAYNQSDQKELTGMLKGLPKSILERDIEIASGPSKGKHTNLATRAAWQNSEHVKTLNQNSEILAALTAIVEHLGIIKTEEEEEVNAD